MTRRTASGARLLEAVILLFLSASVVRGATFLVTNTNDSGGGSLRQAILEANFLGGPDSIAFQIPGPGPYVIAPLSQLPSISGPTIVDGQTQPGYSSGSRVEISGASAGAGVDGLVITGPTCVVVGLVIRNFQPTFLGSAGNGVVLQGGGGSILLGNRIGTNIAGTAAMGNVNNGILIADSPNNRIGPSSGGEARNLISGNGGSGIRITGASHSNQIVGNDIGTNLSGTAALANAGDGVTVLGGSGNVIQSTSALQVISGNLANGITVAGTATSTFIAGNRIGADFAGTADLGNGSDGVEISGSSFNQVGFGNLISGNDANGVLLIGGATNNAVGGNFIGTNLNGLAAIPNAGNGVIVSGSNGNRIGGVSGEGNLISGNGTNGVRIRSGSSGNLVLGNRIGINHAGTVPLANSTGVQLNDGATGNTVGGSLPGEGNQIYGNTGSGVLIADPTTAGNRSKETRSHGTRAAESASTLERPTGSTPTRFLRSAGWELISAATS